MGDTDDSNALKDTPEGVFLERWSRRKTAARKGETDVEPLSTSTELSDADAASAGAELPPQLTDADMPPLESLDQHSDYAVFMSPGVSEQLRTMALRKLFHLPAFNITDGLNDYDEDYTRFAGLGGMVTQEMKRMLKRELEAQAASAEEVQAAAEEVAVSPADAVAENDADVDDDAEESL